MSPRAFSIAVAAWQEERRAERERDIRHAWHVAVFAGQAFAGKLKPLDEMLVEIGLLKPEPQSPLDHKVKVQALAAQLGRSLRPVDPKAAVIPAMVH